MIRREMVAACIALAMVFAACGGDSKEEDPKLKAEIVRLEATNAEMDSTMKAIRKTSEALDMVLSGLEMEK